MSDPAAPRPNGRLLEAVLIELDALSTDLGVVQPAGSSVEAVVAGATDRLNAWCDAVGEETIEVGIAWSAAQVTKLREQLALEDDHRAALVATAAQQREHVRQLRSSIAATTRHAASAEAELACEVDQDLRRDEDALLAEEKALYAELGRLTARAESAHLDRMDKLREENAGLAAGDAWLQRVAEDLAALYASLAPALPEVESMALPELRAGLLGLLAAVEAERDAAASRFEDQAARLADLDALERRIGWAQGELVGRQRFQELLAAIEAPLSAEAASLAEQSAAIAASLDAPNDVERAAESEWIAGEIAGRKIFFELCGEWARRDADEVERFSVELADLVQQARASSRSSEP